MPEYNKVMIRRSRVPRRVINVPQVCGQRKAEFDRRDPRLDKAWCSISTPDAQIKEPNWYNDLNILKAWVGGERRSPAPRRFTTYYPIAAGAVYGVHMVGKRKANHDRRCSHPKGFHSFTLPDFRTEHRKVSVRAYYMDSKTHTIGFYRRRKGDERRDPNYNNWRHTQNRDPRVHALERRKV